MLLAARSPERGKEPVGGLAAAEVLGELKELHVLKYLIPDVILFAFEKSLRERKPSAPKDYEASIASAGGMGGGSQAAKHKKNTGIPAGATR